MEVVKIADARVFHQLLHLFPLKINRPFISRMPATKGSFLLFWFKITAQISMFRTYFPYFNI